ncbi:MAG: hypothetical protein HY986_02220 [Candidatus Melainabacteria bacterium]|nr:hypothetical protein [Candidatus Melainabacteria bacterium]
MPGLLKDSSAGVLISFVALCVCGICLLKGFLGLTFDYIDKVATFKGADTFRPGAVRDGEGVDWSPELASRDLAAVDGETAFSSKSGRLELERTETVIYREQCRFVTETIIAGDHSSEQFARMLSLSMSSRVLRNLLSPGADAAGSIKPTQRSGFRPADFCQVDNVNVERTLSGLCLCQVQGSYSRLREGPPRRFEVNYLVADSFENKPIIVDLRYTANVAPYFHLDHSIMAALTHSLRERSATAATAANRSEAESLCRDLAQALVLSSNEKFRPLLPSLRGSLSPYVYEQLRDFRFGDGYQPGRASYFTFSQRDDIKDLTVTMNDSSPVNPDLLLGKVRGKIAVRGGPERWRHFGFRFVFARRTDLDSPVLIAFRILPEE